jgi:acetyl-CoA acyltransferase
VVVLIAAACRSPFTRVEGALAGWHPVDLTALVMNEALRKAEFTAEDIDEVWVGCAEPVGAQGADMARAAILAGQWPDRVGGVVVDRAETSGMAALHAATAAIASGTIRAAMVVGVCNASMVHPGASALARAYGRPWGDGPAARAESSGGLLPAATAAGRAAVAAGIGRVTQDAWALGSHEHRARFTPASITPVDARPGDRFAIQRGTPTERDDHREIPSDPAALPPSFDSNGTVTAFTFAPPADGVAALLLVAEQSSGLAEVVGVGRSAGHVLDPLGGLPHAAATALRHAGCTADDIDRWELTEPTAAATLLATERLGIETARTNPSGGSLAVGDAAAAEELRLVTDGLTSVEPGTMLACASFGPSGAAVTVVRSS